MRLRWTLVLCLTLNGSIARADELAAVVVGESSELKGAEQIAREAAQALKQPLVEATLARPPSVRKLTGWAVAVHTPKPRLYVVTTFLGSQDEADAELAFVQRRFPAAEKTSIELDPDELDRTYDAWRKYNVLILGSFPDYEEARGFAKKVGKKTRTPFSMRDMLWDDEHGLRYPENFISEDCAGGYSGRRNNECEDDMLQCISIERSNVYVGLGPGLFLVLAGVFDDEHIDAQLERYQRAAPGAYVLRTAVFPGCVH